MAPTEGENNDEEFAQALSVENEAAGRRSIAAAVAGAFAQVVDHEVIPTLPDEPPPGLDAKAAAKKPPAASKPAAAGGKDKPKAKRRLCKFPGCTRTVKAQGHCQKHGARTRRCKVPTCKSQAQGSHEGYCKKHWRELAAPPEERKKPTRKEAEELEMKCDPVGTSVYDALIPSSFMWKAQEGGNGHIAKWGTPTPKKELTAGAGDAMPELGEVSDGVRTDVAASTPKKGDGPHAELIPILQHLVDNDHLTPGWHRAEERLSRGIRPQKSLSVQLEPWERQLAVLEMALIAGTDVGRLSSHRISRILAHAWGREKGFHKMMVEKHCGRRGDLDRKSRVDKGLKKTEEARAAYRAKAAASRVAKKRKAEEPHDALGEVPVPVVAPTADPMAALPLPGGEELAESVAAEFAQAPPEPPLEPPPMEEPTIEEIVTQEI